MTPIEMKYRDAFVTTLRITIKGWEVVKSKGNPDNLELMVLIEKTTAFLWDEFGETID